ncbi:MAG: ribonuclease D [Gammaproteobacteria bacterium]|nr:MAG: ribonuclease D [Gammaproteobacteria bacterium]
MQNSQTPELVNSNEQLEQLCLQLANCRWMALDTEFMREKTYSPQFCLLQIATTDCVACVDPLAIESLDPLLDLIYQPDIIKIFHASRQDLEIFYNLRGSIPAPIFDTQIAAPLLGQTDQIGYANLVKALLNVDLPKTHSRTDWSHRPLSPEQLIYAADDVIYLAQIYNTMREQLGELDREKWLDGDFEALTRNSLYENAPELAWNRIRSAWKLKGASLSSLQLLAEWRETKAQQSNRPRNWILKDDALFDIARQRPDSIDKLKRIRGIPEQTVRRHGETILGLLEAATTRAPIPAKAPPKTSAKSAEKEALLDILMSVTRLYAAQEKINPTTLASRKELEKLLSSPDECALLSGWRKTIIGEKLLHFLDGSQSLSVKNNKVIIEGSK